MVPGVIADQPADIVVPRHTPCGVDLGDWGQGIVPSDQPADTLSCPRHIAGRIGLRDGATETHVTDQPADIAPARHAAADEADLADGRTGVDIANSPTKSVVGRLMVSPLITWP